MDVCTYTEAPDHPLKFKHSRNKSPKPTSLVFFLPYTFSPFPVHPCCLSPKAQPHGHPLWTESLSGGVQGWVSVQGRGTGSAGAWPQGPHQLPSCAQSRPLPELHFKDC